MCNERLQRLFVRANNECAHQVEEALTLPYKRFRIRRFRNLYVFAYKDEITLDTPLSEEPRPQ